MPDQFEFRWLRIAGSPIVVSAAYVAIAIVLGYLAARAFIHLEVVDTHGWDAWSQAIQRRQWAKLATLKVVGTTVSRPPTARLAVIVGLGAVAVYTASILAHEIGHLAAARACGLDVTSIGFNATGGFVELADEDDLTAGSLALVAGAGPLVTALLTVLGYCMRSIWPDGDGIGAGAAVETLLTLFVGVNAVGLAINLLPLGNLDGARLLTAARLRYARA